MGGKPMGDTPTGDTPKGGKPMDRMATPDDFSDEILMAYADGELDEARHAAVEAAIARDEALAERIAMFAETANRAKQAMDATLSAPVPAQLQRAVEGLIAAQNSGQNSGQDTGDAKGGAPADPVSLADHRARRESGQRDLGRPGGWRRVVPAAMAASVALVVGLGVGYGLRPGPDGTGAGGAGMAVSGLTGPAEPAIAAALAEIPSGAEQALAGGRTFRAIASFRDETGAVCREFEVDGEAGRASVNVACRDADRWEVRISIATATGGAGYAPASSLEALDAYLVSVGAGAPMSAQEEKAALTAAAP